MRIFLIAITLTLTCSAASAETITGPASVIDGDTIQVRGEVIRIFDIDAPEKDQFCSQAEDDTTWRCGEQAAFALIDVIGTQLVTCETDKLDRYGAHLAGCMAGETNLGEWMAAEGLGSTISRLQVRDHQGRERVRGDKSSWPVDRGIHPAMGVARGKLMVSRP